VFSGIVAEVGRVTSVVRKGAAVLYRVAAPQLARELDTGVSVAVNGVCQTVTDVGSDTFSFESVAETLRRTNLSLLRQGALVNLELALRLTDRISGHLVSGHIDCTGIVRAKKMLGSTNIDFTIQVPARISAYIYEKGSICLDGVSLTAKGVRGSMVEVTLIPFTLENTIIKYWRVGTVVNVEVDQVAKYLTPKPWVNGGGKA
jgi:riboflavin synthase